MRTARIATSRTGTRDQGALITYRPLPESYGDAALLRAVRRARRRAEAAGLDPSLVEVDVDALRPARRPRRDRSTSRGGEVRGGGAHPLGALLQPRHRHA